MYNFDDKPDRVSEKCRKWDLNIIRDKFGDIREDFIPMWIADMDFKIPSELVCLFFLFPNSHANSTSALEYSIKISYSPSCRGTNFIFGISIYITFHVVRFLFY